MRFFPIWILLFLFTNIAVAQQNIGENSEIEKNTITADSLEYPVKYCLLIPSGKFLSRHIEIQIDYGQDLPLLKNSYIRTDSGEKRKFNSVIQALNYMNSLGWKLIKTYNVQETTKSFSNYFLFEADKEAVLPKNQ